MCSLRLKSGWTAFPPHYTIACYFLTTDALFEVTCLNCRAQPCRRRTLAEQVFGRGCTTSNTSSSVLLCNGSASSSSAFNCSHAKTDVSDLDINAVCKQNIISIKTNILSRCWFHQTEFFIFTSLKADSARGMASQWVNRSVCTRRVRASPSSQAVAVISIYLSIYFTYLSIYLFYLPIYLRAVHKVRHAILDQFWLPLSHFVTHLGTPP